MNDAIAELERKKSLQKAKKSNGQGSKSSSQKTSGHKAPVPDTAACGFQEAASCSHSNIAEHWKVESKAPFHPPPLHAASQSSPPEPLSSQLPPSSHSDVKKTKSPLSQSEEKTSNKKADKYPKEFDAFGEKEPDDRERFLSWKNDLCKETTLKDAKLSDGKCVNKNLDQADRNNNLTKNCDASFSKNDSRDDDRGTTVPLKTPLVQNETVLKKATRHVHLVGKELKRAKGKESSKLKEGDDGHHSAPEQAPLVSDGLFDCETRSIPSADASPSKKGGPFNQEEIAPDTSDPEASTPGDVAGSRTVVNSAVPEQDVVVKDIECSNPIQKNQHERETVSPISHHCLELSVYIREETFLLQHEITSLEKVSTKLEQEIQEAIEITGRGNELQGLTQDWVWVNQCRSELIKRKRDLEIMSREENLEECLTEIRQELMFLMVELEDWRKTDQHIACAQKLIDLLVSLVRKNEFNNCLTGFKF